MLGAKGFEIPKLLIPSEFPQEAFLRGVDCPTPGTGSFDPAADRSEPEYKLDRIEECRQMGGFCRDLDGPLRCRGGAPWQVQTTESFD